MFLRDRFCFKQNKTWFHQNVHLDNFVIGKQIVERIPHLITKKNVWLRRIDFLVEQDDIQHDSNERWRKI